MRGERKIIKNYFFWFSICVHTVSNLEWYCSFILNFLAFRSCESSFGLSVPNVKGSFVTVI